MVQAGPSIYHIGYSPAFPVVSLTRYSECCVRHCRLLEAAKKAASAGMFWKLLVGTIVVLAFGCGGEANFVNGWIGLASSMDALGFHPLRDLRW